jgi:hypothetical protein
MEGIWEAVSGDRPQDGGSEAVTQERVGFLFNLCSAALLALCSWEVFITPMNGDTAWFLNCSERIAAGARLYEDIIDMNPPFVHYYGLPAVWIARLFSVFDVTVLNAYTHLLIILSLYLCFRTLRDKLQLGKPVLQISLVALIYVTLKAPLTLMAYTSFAEREHLFVICVLPYLLHAIARERGQATGRGEAVLTGCLAGFGFA